MAVKKKAAEAMKTLLLSMADGSLQKVTVPAKFKVTFGAIVPGAKNYESARGWSLRLYDGTKQVAVFCGVLEFHEEGAVKILKRVTETKKRKIGKQGPHGFKDAVVEARIHKWRDPMDENDDSDEELLALTDGEGDWES